MPIATPPPDLDPSIAPPSTTLPTDAEALSIGLGDVDLVDGESPIAPLAFTQGSKGQAPLLAEY
ncbi:hypothetical protein VARIO8X_160199 [Burkholderiales bacterium 8X]|nr:hypothetical protein VARIO8X_160199 [Burkholderiales bacterium 8X]